MTIHELCWVKGNKCKSRKIHPSIQEKLVWGLAGMRLPSEFFSAPPATVAPSPHHYVQSLRQSLLSFRPEDAVTRTCPRPSYISHDMDTCGMVHLRTDAVRKPLQPPYSGPCNVLHRSAKHFRLDINGKATEVSINRLKSAYSLSSHSATAVSALFWPDPTTVLLSPAAMPFVSFVPRAHEVTFARLWLISTCLRGLAFRFSFFTFF